MRETLIRGWLRAISHEHRPSLVDDRVRTRDNVDSVYANDTGTACGTIVDVQGHTIRFRAIFSMHSNAASAWSQKEQSNENELKTKTVMPRRKSVLESAEAVLEKDKSAVGNVCVTGRS